MMSVNPFAENGNAEPGGHRLGGGPCFPAAALSTVRSPSSSAMPRTQEAWSTGRIERVSLSTAQRAADPALEE